MTPVGTVTEYEFIARDLNDNCDPHAAPTQLKGIDGLVVDMAGDTHIRVTGSSETSNLYGVSLNIQFYDTDGLNCNRRPPPTSINNGGASVYKWSEGYTNSDGNKVLVYSTPARWAVVTLYRGATVTVNWITCSPERFPLETRTYCF